MSPAAAPATSAADTPTVTMRRQVMYCHRPRRVPWARPSRRPRAGLAAASGRRPRSGQRPSEPRALGPQDHERGRSDQEGAGCEGHEAGPCARRATARRAPSNGTEYRTRALTWPADEGLVVGAVRVATRHELHARRTCTLGDHPVGHQRRVTGDRLERDDVADLHLRRRRRSTRRHARPRRPGRTSAPSTPSGPSASVPPSALGQDDQHDAPAATTTSSSAHR